ncbi:DUF397 domain-containing protein [Jidongwangia harbinensis]|uniref:DUF397 domain-containing protein n=1 Tax=Jidongwangia harbinensis TaxID=2878561 RepID=UPI001CD9F3BB|nr:DUF397 domain-containing protein [Jidongwangia harbinensis]MCA2213273.1 DUF397 domain-containing protein [Jidongwangia harbinensis]
MDLTNARWRKSSISSGNGGDCVEVASNLPNLIAVRDSKEPAGPVLLFGRRGWQAFLDGLKSGDFDR